ncbi:helix-turn-helix domain-containing protein [Actinoplanes teichomyceticus]|uniref:Helix-turn-helix protein n=1 Tax=Actinoplanes teichomyceticus TaxID=1867 RepID=Q6ZZG2_ACTTI|nr:helix-turn-helix domain-containing protein [Actinoplanes teichomyceticus]TWG09446.1 helix-turn-helix protein [Actinoplanes teichomyceticus]GIF17135.1 hypothetical protein Ate01nite_71670 [Actinoplanes teichomyceticus]CAG15043.1 transcriptional regulator [Actinoplanes teichomyceticus]
MFGEHVRTHRQRLGLTQDDLAERAGLGVRSIRNIEAGRVRVPRPSTVRLLADAFALTGPARDLFCSIAAAPRAVPVAPSDPPVVPRQLPAASPAHVGRRAALAALDQLLVTPCRLAVVQGPAGIGKSTLALHWAHRVASRFPDGQLYLDLQGYGPAPAPLGVADALCRLLDGFGVPAARIPADTDARAALLRSVTADRSFLLVLDNARDADQVRPLLPGAPGAVTVVTSRADHAGLVTTAAARLVPLGLFHERDAIDLLTHHLGAERVAAEPAAVSAIIGRCARLPLALAIIAGRGAARADFPLSELTGGPSVLDELTGDDVGADFRTVISWSYRLLSTSAARLFRLLGAAPGRDIGPAAAASLAGTPVRATRRDLRELTAAHLAHEHRSGRYQVHALLRSYAVELCSGHDPASERDTARRRLVDHYLHAAYAAAPLLAPRLARGPLPARCDGVTAERPADSRAAFDWFTDEYPNLVEVLALARDLGLHAHAWQLAGAVGAFRHRRGRWHDVIGPHRDAPAVAPGDPIASGTPGTGSA